eukprot:NODE_5952_length_1718_cov_2.546826.p1 GENE.NODE_5952_length_1718_cov_2.546826~~NODE_5952_length_1718_cov_2.546826.p1  ORF type:complete len:449 (-),score=102.30 NODE_5952_length_1718_cov_2.546826:281-1627(-)
MARAAALLFLALIACAPLCVHAPEPSWDSVRAHGFAILGVMGRTLRSLATNEAFIESVGTTSRRIRMLLFMTILNVPGDGLNAKADNLIAVSRAMTGERHPEIEDDLLQECADGFGVLAVLAAVIAVTKEKKRAIRMLTTLAATDTLDLPVERAIQIVMKLPNDAKLAIRTNTPCYKSLGGALPDLVLYFRCNVKQFRENWVCVNNRFFPEAMVCPELAQLSWTEGSKELVQSVDVYFWTQVVSKNGQPGVHNAQIFATKWSDKYGFSEPKDLTTLGRNLMTDGGVVTPKKDTETAEFANQRMQGEAVGLEQFRKTICHQMCVNMMDWLCNGGMTPVVGDPLESYLLEEGDIDYDALPAINVAKGTQAFGTFPKKSTGDGDDVDDDDDDEEGDGGQARRQAARRKKKAAEAKAKGKPAPKPKPAASTGSGTSGPAAAAQATPKRTGPQ